MNFKYDSQIKEYEECEIASCRSFEREAYRWTFGTVDHPENFVPRYLTRQYDNLVKDCCLGYALSMFQELEQAENKLSRICRTKQFLYKRLGTHISRGILLSEDGVSSESNLEGHFSFFEAAGVNLSSRFSIAKQVYP